MKLIDLMALSFFFSSVYALDLWSLVLWTSSSQGALGVYTFYVWHRRNLAFYSVPDTMLEDIHEKDTAPVLMKKIFFPLMEKLMFCGRVHINALLCFLFNFHVREILHQWKGNLFIFFSFFKIILKRLCWRKAFSGQFCIFLSQNTCVPFSCLTALALGKLKAKGHWLLLAC